MRLMIAIPEAEYGPGKQELLAALAKEDLLSDAFVAHGLDPHAVGNGPELRDELWELMKDDDGCVRLDIEPKGRRNIGSHLREFAEGCAAHMLHFHDHDDGRNGGLVDVDYHHDGDVTLLSADELDPSAYERSFGFLVSVLAEPEFFEAAKAAQMICDEFEGREPRQAHQQTLSM